MRGRLLLALRSGRYAIDWWEGDPRLEYHEDYLSSAEFVRPAVKGLEGYATDPTYGGPCTFLGSSGCELAHDDRPRNCRGLVPRVGDSCQERRADGSAVGKRDYILAWIPYLDLLEEVRREAKGGKR